MVDPLFDKSVIYIYEHDTNGAKGLIINKSIEQIITPLADLSKFGKRDQHTEEKSTEEQRNCIDTTNHSSLTLCFGNKT